MIFAVCERLSANDLMDHSAFTILLVDDELDAREGLSLRLELEGYVVLQAADGQEALDKLKNIDSLPSVIVLDLTMPVLDGRGFLIRRAREPNLADIPVIIVSGSKPDDDELLSDVRAFLQKPVEVTRFLEIISRLEVISY